MNQTNHRLGIFMLTFCIVLIIVSAASVFAGFRPHPSEDIDFVSIEMSSFDGALDREVIAKKDEGFLIIEIHQGAQLSGGFGVEVTRVVETRDVVNVYVIETQPSDDCSTLHVLTAPYHKISIPFTEKPLHVIYAAHTTICD